MAALPTGERASRGVAERPLHACDRRRATLADGLNLGVGPAIPDQRSLSDPSHGPYRSCMYNTQAPSPVGDRPGATPAMSTIVNRWLSAMRRLKSAESGCPA